MPFRLVGSYQRFGEICCLRHDAKTGSRTSKNDMNLIWLIPYIYYIYADMYTSYTCTSLSSHLNTTPVS